MGDHHHHHDHHGHQPAGQSWTPSTSPNQPGYFFPTPTYPPTYQTPYQTPYQAPYQPPNQPLAGANRYYIPVYQGQVPPAAPQGQFPTVFYPGQVQGPVYPPAYPPAYPPPMPPAYPSVTPPAYSNQPTWSTSPYPGTTAR